VITTHLHQTPLVVAYLGRPTGGLNTNVVLEIGYRLATGLPLVILSEPPGPDEKGRVPKFQELLPFDLLHRQIIEVPTDPASALQDLTREIGETKNLVPRSHWPSPHPLLEVKFTNIEKDLRFTEVSVEAKKLFGEDHFREDGTVDQVRSSINKRVPEVQLKAVRKEFRRIMAEMQNRFSGLVDEDAPPEVPVFRIPLMFNEEFARPAGEPRVAHLPVIVRHSIEEGVTFVRLLYLRVSRGLMLNQAKGHYEYEL